MIEFQGTLLQHRLLSRIGGFFIGGALGLFGTGIGYGGGCFGWRFLAGGVWSMGLLLFFRVIALSRLFMET